MLTESCSTYSVLFKYVQCVFAPPLNSKPQFNNSFPSPFIRRDLSPNGWSVSLGSVFHPGLGALVIPVQRIIIHTGYNSTSKDFDVALVELSIPAPRSYTIQPVCLPSPLHVFNENTECYVTGWGAMAGKGERQKHESEFML